MVITCNSLACKISIITYQNFKIHILKAYAYAYKKYPLSSWDWLSLLSSALARI